MQQQRTSKSLPQSHHNMFQVLGQLTLLFWAHVKVLLKATQLGI